ncbi:MAG: glycosyltransferase [Solirubrobacteraceae bacterium]
MTRWNRKRARYVWDIARRGPTEVGYAYFRARRRRRNLADDAPELSESDRLVLGGDYDLEASELAASAEVVAAWERAGRARIESIQWFLPWFHLVYGGGIYTVLRFADRFAAEHGAVNRFHVYDRADERAARDIAAKIADAFPRLAQAPVTAAGAELPPADAAIATAWTSAFPLVRHRGTRAKFFFVQDLEPDFYPAGAASAVLEQAARFGLPGIVNTPGLADVYRSYGNRAVAFAPAVDTRRYRPADSRRTAGATRIFFYGRPSQPRNAFGLGLAALRLVKRRFGDRVEIVCAGEDWSPGQYGAADVLDNLGQLEELDAVADLYRSCDIGLAFMLTPHPSYQPLEFMASGVATVSNHNPHTGWLLRHEANALLAPALPALVAEQVSRLVEDPGLRNRIARTGREEVARVRWEDEIDRVWEAMTSRTERFEPASEPRARAPAPEGTLLLGG